ncbi:MAG: HD domain-containing protein [Porticoccaceae bacterium]|nr:HD domain-containing protein [Porticoccaceae bacterium]
MKTPDTENSPKAANPQQAVAQISSLFKQFADNHYGEACSQLEHAISCARHARHQSLPDAMAIAALLHDIGHFVADQRHLPEFDQWGYAAHDSLGADFLKSLGFDCAVTEPIRLHVEAKRYLAASDPATLSTASTATLQQQGGAMTPEECKQFRAHPWHQQALQLRQLDDLGKPQQPIATDLEPWLMTVEGYLKNLQKEHL